MAAASSAASTGIEPGERDGIGSAMPTETVESKEMYRGFIALRLATCSTVGTTIKPRALSMPDTLSPRPPRP
jgi:hypothetical protein